MPQIEIDDAWLEPTWFIDSEASEVSSFVDTHARHADGALEQAIALFYAVRDQIRYDPYGISYDPQAFRASAVAVAPANWCVPKSVLLTACARSLGIPARLGYADVRNHLTSKKLSESMGTDLFIWHGYAELLLPDPDGEAADVRWFKLSTAFNIELCDRFGVTPLEFDGTADALMHPFDRSGNRHMEYTNQRGSFDDLPLDRMLADFAEMYGTRFGEVTAADSAEAAGDDAFA
jgi:transglutaminase-like putative cysteine protease